jgi:twinkle protein
MNIQIDGHERYYKDANEAFLNGVDLKVYLKHSQGGASKHLLNIHDLSEDIMNRIFNFKEIAGIKNRYFPWFNDMIKGFRRGELTILTGQTGAGKTTFLSQYSLGFLEANIPTLWGSFEIKNEIMGTTML